VDRNEQIDKYLSEVSNGLNLTKYDKSDVVEEIKNHIYESLNRQETLENVLVKLGEPNKLAKAYNHSYSLENNKFGLSDIFGSIAFYSSVAISSMIVITVLPVVSIVFVLVSVFITGIAITNNIGLTNMPFNIGFMPVNGFLQIILAVAVSIVLLLIARISWRGLKKYLKTVSVNYHKRRIGIR